MAKTIKVRFAAYAKNMGDGDIAIRFYRNRAIAEADAKFDDSRSPGDIVEHEFEIASNGEIIVGHRVDTVSIRDVTDAEAVNHHATHQDK